MKNFAILILLFTSCTAIAQNLTVEGAAKINSMLKNNDIDSVVVRFPDGTLGVRDVQTIRNTQILSISNDTIFLTDGGFIKLPPDEVIDADASATNELQTLSQTGNTVTLSDGGGSISVADNDNDPNNEIETWSTLSGIPADFADNTDNVDDADASATNELQTLSQTGNTVTLSDGGGSISVADNDNDPNNEIETWSTLSGIPTDFADNTDNVNDADADPSNEIQDLSLSGNTLTITNNGSATPIDLSPFAGVDTDDQNLSLGTRTGTTQPINITDGTGVSIDVADNDNDSGNEFQTLSKTGLNVTLSDGGGTISVADNDNNATNEIQTISKSGSTVSLSLSGGSFTDEVNDADADPGNELQSLSVSGSNLNISGGSGVALSLIQDGVDDADANPTNEIQDLNLSGNTLTITNNGSATPIDLSTYIDTDTDDQDLSLGTRTGTTQPINITDGSGVNIDVADNDNDSGNEIQTISRSGLNVTLSNSGGSFSVADNDNDATNEIETWSTLAGIPAGFADNTDNVNDADANPGNEYNTAFAFAANGDLTISDAGMARTVNLTSLFHSNSLQVGSIAVPAGYEAAVDGKIICEEVTIRLSGTWPDYVFNDSYPLMPLKDVKSYIDSNGHLPRVPSAKVIEQEGVHTQETLKILMEKVEELTLYTIEQQELIEKQGRLIEALQEALEQR